MTDTEFVVRGRRIVTENGIRPAAIHIRHGRIAALTDMDREHRSPGYDAGDSIVMPGVVDTHVHINEPGRTEWEGFHSATRSAAAGGITTLVDMPLNSVPPTTTVGGLVAKQQAAAGRCWVDVGFWGGVVPGNSEELPALARAGVLGFKCFLVPSGVDEFPAVAKTDLEAAMPILARSGLPLLAHAEWPGLIDAADEGPLTRYADYVATRPAEAEHRAVSLLIDLCRRTGARVHIVHVSSAGTARLLRVARDERLAVSAETCPHYLTFTARDVPDGATEFKCAPPIRSAADRDGLWAALSERDLQMVVTDHSPSPPELKRREAGDFREAWGGIASLQLSLPAVWTAGREHGARLEDLADWMCRAPARLAGLDDRKGAIATGFDADLVVWDPEAAFEVDPGALHHRHPLTPYAGRTLRGVVRTTFLRGIRIYDRGAFCSSPAGQQIAKRRTSDS